MTYKKLGCGNGVCMSGSLMIRLHNTLCSFSDTDVNEAWSPQNRGMETERFSKGQKYSFTSQH